MNLETGTMAISVGNRSLEAHLRHTRRYATQFRLFTTKLTFPELPIEYALTHDALSLTLQIRNMGFAAEMDEYDSEEVTPASALWP